MRGVAAVSVEKDACRDVELCISGGGMVETGRQGS